jgi:peptidoglycan-associated lipoprotein
MKSTVKSLVLPLFMMMSLLFLMNAGCAKKQAATETTAADGAAMTEDMGPGMQQPMGLDESTLGESAMGEESMDGSMGPAVAAVSALEKIQFDFDQYVLSAEAQAILVNNADYLKANPDQKVRIEGHCDERGSDEYNLALGQRRALAAKNFLVSLGIAPERLSVISYGEEMPLDPSGTEEAFALNRRAEFKAEL